MNEIAAGWVRWLDTLISALLRKGCLSGARSLEILTAEVTAQSWDNSREKLDTFIITRIREEALKDREIQTAIDDMALSLASEVRQDIKRLGIKADNGLGPTSDGGNVLHGFVADSMVRELSERLKQVIDEMRKGTM